MLLQLVLVYTCMVLCGGKQAERKYNLVFFVYTSMYISTQKMFAAVRNIPTQRHSDSVSLVFDACRCNVSSLKISNLRAT